MKKDNLPKYVKLGRVALRLRDDEYWCDGGQWGVDYKIINDKLLSRHSLKHLNNIELIPITEDEYRINNGRYCAWFCYECEKKSYDSSISSDEISKLTCLMCGNNKFYLRNSINNYDEENK